MFYQQGSERVDVSCESLSTTKGPVEGQPFPYSDHETLSTELVLCSSEKGEGNSNQPQDCTPGILTSENVSVMCSLVASKRCTFVFVFS